jgi:hypothetical protein
MNRRTFVTGTATAATLGLAGCLGGNEEQPRTDDEHVDALRAEIDDRGIEVLDVQLAENVVEVEHRTQGEPNDAIADVAMAFVERIAEEWDVERLDGYLRDELGNDWAWHAEAEWAEAYADGEIGPEEYGERLRGTLSQVLGVEE